MVRSFSDRVLAGVCGGVGAWLHLNAWILRLLLIVLAVASGGILAALYLALWWALPQGSPARAVRGALVRVVYAAALIAVFVALWLGRHEPWLAAPSGESLLLPAMLLVLSVVFVLRQLRV
jgi:phage shock protein C